MCIRDRNFTNRAALGEDTVINANGFRAEATMTNVEGDLTHTFTSTAASGAGSDDIGVAGSFALNVTTGVSEALIPSSAIVTAGTGDVSLRAENYRADTVTAKADAKAGKVGIGAAIAINPVLENVTRAEIEDGARISGGHDVLVEALSSDQVVTEAVSYTHLGAGVALTLSTVVNHAVVPVWLTVTARNLTLLSLIHI